MKHFIVAALVVIVLAVLMLFGLEQVSLLPVAASYEAGPIDWLFGLHFKIIAILFSLIVGLMLYSIFVFRRKKGDSTDAAHVEGNTPLEVIWTLVPLAAVIYVSYLGAVILGDIQEREPGALEVDVIASQWSWRFEYPDQGLTTGELILPAGRQVLLRLRSNDVIHSFWVPEFRVKQDVLPGGENMIREIRIRPTEIGEYTLRCAEMCGQQHSIMETPVKVMALADFDAWVTEQAGAVPTDPVGRGQLWSNQYGCVACHSVDGALMLGPTWKGLYGSERPLQDGTTVTADDEYLYEAIRQPHTQLVQGFPNAMPANIAEGMTDEQVADVIEFIKSLK